MNSKNNGPVFLFKIILRHKNYFLPSIVTDGKDGHRLKVEKLANFFQGLCSACKNLPKKHAKCSLMKFVCIFVITLQKHFVNMVKALSNGFSTELT